MAERKTLMKIEYITDHSCGMYRIGEIDSMPDWGVEEHINKFGEYGYEQLRDYAIRMLTQAHTLIVQQRMTAGQSQACEASAGMKP